MRRWPRLAALVDGLPSWSVASERRSPWLDANLRADALEVLGDVPHWQLPPGRWGTVRGALEAVYSAVEVMDAGALLVAVQELEFTGPVRATTTDGPETVDPPEPVRDLINKLVHDLSGEAPEKIVGQS